MASIPHVKEEQWTFALQFYLDQNGLPHLDKASINEVYYEEVPVKSTTTATPTPTTTTEGENTATTEAKPEEKKTEKVKKERSTLCIVKMIECLFGLPQAILDNVTSKEASQENEDRLLTLAINKRNEIENFIYSTRSKFDGELGAYVTSEEKEVLLALMQKIEDWFYSGDEEVYNKTVLESKSKDVSELGSKIYKRYHDWNKLSESLGKLERVVNLNIKKLEETTTQTSYLTQADRDEIAQIIVQYNNLLNEGKTSYAKFPKFGDAPAKYEDVDKVSEEFVKVSRIILIN
jgi:heat shock protein 4